MITTYQEHVEKSRNHTEEAQKHHEADTEDEEIVRKEEEALKQQLGSIEKDIKDLNTVCAAQDTEMEKLKQTYGFRQRWAKAQWGEEWRQSSPAPSATEAEKPPASKAMKQ